MDTSLTSIMQLNNLAVTQRRTSLTLNNTVVESVIKNPKRIKKKLSRFFNVSLDTEHVDETQTRRHQIVQHLIENYEYCFAITNDGNELYRIGGIHLLKSVLGNQAKLEEFCQGFSSKDVNPHILKNVPFQFVQLCKKEKLLKTLRTLIQCIRKKPSVSFYRSVSSLLNNYAVFDFTLVSICRLYTYFFGYLETKHYDHIEYEELIIDYSLEATSEVVKIMADCFKAEFHIYSVSPDVGIMYYIPKVKGQTQPVVTLQVGMNYCLLEKINQHKRSKHQEDPKIDLPQWTETTNKNINFVEQNEIRGFQETELRNQLSVQIATNQRAQTKSNWEKPNYQVNLGFREDLKLSQISNVQSEYMRKESTPPRQTEQIYPNFKSKVTQLTLVRLNDITILPARTENRLTINIDHFPSSTSLIKRTAGRIHKQCLSPMNSPSSKATIQAQNTEKVRLSQGFNESYLNQGVEPSPAYSMSRLIRQTSDKRITIHTKQFSIELFKN